MRSPGTGVVPKWSTALLAILSVNLLSAAASPLAAQAQNADLTFTRDVAPILQEKCMACHRPNAIAPMSLTTYSEVRPWLPIIRDRVANRKMPPYFIDRSVGIQHYKDDRGLTDEQLTTIIAWIDSGAPQGDAADLPPPVSFDDGAEWTLTRALGREPDLIVPIPEPFLVPGDGPNWWIDFTSETGLTEDRYIMAYETRPSPEGFPVVHHNITDMYTGDFANPDWRVHFSEYALGKTGDIFPKDSGQLIKAGTKLRWNLHYSPNPTGEDTYDQSRIALWFFPRGDEPKYQLVRGPLGTGVTDLDIPAGEDRARFDGYTILKDNVRLAIFQPHMHNLGARQCMEVIYPDGRVQTLSCADWDFGWHIAYTYEDDWQPLIPKGSVLHLISYFNNSESNPWAGDDRNWVGWGNRSTDEMAFAHISYYVMSDEEFDEAVRQRQELWETWDADPSSMRD
jgi:hypothetical protein